jgi:hypothetical protein
VSIFLRVEVDDDLDDQQLVDDLLHLRRTLGIDVITKIRETEIRIQDFDDEASVEYLVEEAKGRI